MAIGTLMKRRFVFPTAYTITLVVIALVALLTWIMPTGSYDYQIVGSETVIPAAQVQHYTGDQSIIPVPDSYVRVPENPQGFFDFFMAPIEGIYAANEIIFFVLVIGGFLGVVMKTGAIDAGIAAIITRLENREEVMIVVLMCLLALGGATFGMGEETLPFYPLLIPVMIRAGYDSALAFLILLLGSQAGCLAALVNPFSTGIASHIIGVGIGEGMWVRVVLLLSVLTINILITLSYARRVKSNPAVSLSATAAGLTGGDSTPESNGSLVTPFNRKRKLIITLFLLTFAIYIYSVLPLNDLGITLLPTLGWSFTQITAFFAISAIFIGMCYGMKEKEFVDNFLIGASDLLGVALIVGMTRGITVVMEDGLIIDTVLYWSALAISDFSSVMCINVIYGVHAVLAFFIPSTSGLASISMPIMGPLASFKEIPKDLVVTAYQAASGIVNFITPTSAVVMGGLVLSQVSYWKFLKYIIPKLGFVVGASLAVLSFGFLLR